MTAAVAAQRLRRFASAVFQRQVRPPHGPVARGLLRVMLRVRDWSREDFRRNRSIARRIWGTDSGKRGKRSNLEWFVFASPIKQRGEVLSLAIEAKGLPAMIESGGKTKEHMIKPRSASLRSTRSLSTAEMRLRHRRGRRTLVGQGVLAWEGPGGMVFRRIVSRHSARIKARPVIKPLWEREVGAVADAVDRELQESTRRLLDG